MSATDTPSSDVRRTIDAVWRIESARLIAGLTRLVRDVGRAEELAQDALVAALEQWPRDGIPDNPGAWLMTTARRRAIDFIRRNKSFERRQDDIGRERAGAVWGSDRAVNAMPVPMDVTSRTAASVREGATAVS